MKTCCLTLSFVQAMLTESEHRFNEVNKLLYEFERDILRGAVSTVSSNNVLCLVIDYNYHREQENC